MTSNYRLISSNGCSLRELRTERKPSLAPEAAVYATLDMFTVPWIPEEIMLESPEKVAFIPPGFVDETDPANPDVVFSDDAPYNKSSVIRSFEPADAAPVALARLASDLGDGVPTLGLRVVYGQVDRVLLHRHDSIPCRTASTKRPRMLSLPRSVCASGLRGALPGRYPPSVAGEGGEEVDEGATLVDDGCESKLRLPRHFCDCDCEV